MRGPFLRFVAGIFSVINNSCRTTIVGVQRQQGRVLTSDNDHHHPPLTSADICCSVQSCSDAVRAANHYSDSNTSGANITTALLTIQVVSAAELRSSVFSDNISVCY